MSGRNWDWVRARLESADLVTTALRQGANPALGLLAEPLELMCRDLDGPARLNRDGRRHARRWLLAQLTSTSNPLAGLASRDAGRWDPDHPGLVLVVGADPHTVDRWARALWRTGLFDRPDPTEAHTLDGVLRHLDAERRWHLPAWAEWFERTDHTEALRPLRVAPHGGRDRARPVLLASWQHGERVDEVIDHVTAVVVETTPVEASVEAFIEDVVRQRRQWSADGDPDAVARYWRWRLSLGRDRYESWRGAAATPILEVTADDEPFAVAGRCAGLLRR